jgi:hypothetical protein
MAESFQPNDASPTAAGYVRGRDASEFLHNEIAELPPDAATELDLARLRSVGGGPPYVKFGRKVFYPKVSLLDWARSRLSRFDATKEAARVA